MANRDPKDCVRENIESAFKQIPRTRSGMGWYFNSSKIPFFISDIAGSVCGKQEIAAIDISLDLAGIIRDAILYRKSPNGQRSAKIIISMLTAYSQPSVEAIIMKGMEKHTVNQGMYNRYFHDDKDKAKFIDYIIDNIFSQHGIIRTDNMENLVSRIFPFLKTGANIQGRAEAIARGLFTP